MWLYRTYWSKGSYWSNWSYWYARSYRSNWGNWSDHTTLHYEYTGSVSITNRALADNHGMSLNIIAVQITRTANA